MRHQAQQRRLEREQLRQLRTRRDQIDRAIRALERSVTPELFLIRPAA